MSVAARPVVVVPVFNAVESLGACLSALSRTLSASDCVHIADDASTDERVPDVCMQFSRSCQARVNVVRRDRNLGFVGNVNAAFSETRGHDVVLLNSDTVPSTGWLEHMATMATSDPAIATLTPWSNNAEICSYPEFCRPAQVPDEAELQRLAAAAARLADLPPMDLPTGVGFAMFVRRQALDQLGGFDSDTFGRGYGEENDFCMRAAAHGWRNVLCHTAFVAHLGGASFGPTGLRPGGQNLAHLLARYPDYNRRVAEFILRDPLKPYRDRLTAALAQP